MSEEKAKLSGPDLTLELNSQRFLTERCCSGTRSANRCSLSGAATSCSRSVPSARTMVRRSNRGSSWGLVTSSSGGATDDLA
jgi:hypothetical protein